MRIDGAVVDRLVENGIGTLIRTPGAQTRFVSVADGMGLEARPARSPSEIEDTDTVTLDSDG